MQHVVAEVAAQEAGLNGRKPGTEDQVEAEHEQSGQRDTHRWGHHEPHGIVRVVVVHAVDDPVQARTDAMLGLEVEDDPGSQYSVSVQIT